MVGENDKECNGCGTLANPRCLFMVSGQQAENYAFWGEVKMEIENWSS